MNEEDKWQKELRPLRRMTKKQEREVYTLFDEGKTFEQISEHFRKKYNCYPPSVDRLRKLLSKNKYIFTHKDFFC